MEQLAAKPRRRIKRPRLANALATIAGFFSQLSRCALGRVLTSLEFTRRHFEQVAADRGPILAHENDRVALRLRDDAHTAAMLDDFEGRPVSVRQFDVVDADV